MHHVSGDYAPFRRSSCTTHAVKMHHPLRRIQVEESIEETLTFMDFPSQHWTRIRTNNTLERVNREIKRRTRPIGAFPDGSSALMLVCARLRHVAGTDWGNKRYMSMEHLLEMDASPALSGRCLRSPEHCLHRSGRYRQDTSGAGIRVRVLPTGAEDLFHQSVRTERQIHCRPACRQRGVRSDQSC